MPDEKAGEAQHLCQSSKGSGEGVKKNRHTVGISADPWDPNPMISNTFSAHAWTHLVVRLCFSLSYL